MSRQFHLEHEDEVSDNTHCSLHHWLRRGRLLRNDPDELKHIVHVLLEQVELACFTETMDDARVGLQHSLAKAVQVLYPFLVVCRTVREPCVGGLLQHLHDRLEVLLKLARDGKRNVAKAGHDGSLDLPVHGVVLQVGVEDLQDGVAVGDDLAFKGSAEVTHNSGGHQADLDVVIVLQPDSEMRGKHGHEPLEVASDRIGHSRHEQQGLLLQDLAASLHLLVGRDDLDGPLHDLLSNGKDLLPEPLHQCREHATDVALQLALPVHVLEGA
mmetsp:Transcript_86431/g.201068  ORF Transcript_86431/g.201068 Transcript_86431/m.201068 type:complete len:270 (-) Transcript_86431:1873-2682(-)